MPNPTRMAVNSPPRGGRLLVAAFVLVGALATTRLADAEPAPETTTEPTTAPAPAHRGDIAIANAAFFLGGYASVELETRDEADDALSVDDLSLFLSLTPIEKLSFFVEAEVESALGIDGDGLYTRDAEFRLERAYAELVPTAALTVRLGQMLTPLGIWNRIHAAPLVWTTSRPIVTERLYDTGTTGVEVEVHGVLHGYDLVTTFFGQATENIDDPDDLQRSRRAAGTRVELGTIGAWHTAVSAVHFRDATDDRTETTFGFDAAFESARWELTTEFAWNEPTDGGRESWSLYAQAVLHAGYGLHPVLRFEHADLDGVVRNPVIVGLAYKPSPASIVKIEYVTGNGGIDRDGNGPLASLSILF